jgi:hypothetical protein
VRRRSVIIGFTIAYVASAVAFFLVLAQQDRITKVSRNIQTQVTQNLDAGRVCREGTMNVQNCRALIDRIASAATAKQENSAAVRLIRSLTVQQMRQLGIQPAPKPSVNRRGETGNAGARGRPGAAGSSGSRGERGSAGRSGTSGDRGAQGQRGPAGKDGKDGAPGARGPAGPQGPPGSAAGAPTVAEVVAAVCSRLPPGLCK